MEEIGGNRKDHCWNLSYWTYEQLNKIINNVAYGTYRRSNIK